MEKGDTVRHPFAGDVREAILARRSTDLQSIRKFISVFISRNRIIDLIAGLPEEFALDVPLVSGFPAGEFTA